MIQPKDIFESYLYKYIPETYKFSDITEREIRKLVDNYKTRFENLLKESDLDKINYTPHCIFDLLVLAENDRTEVNQYSQLLNHIEKIVESLLQKVDESLHSKLKETIRQMIVSIDKKIGNNYQYLNFYGEILGLEFFLSKDDGFKLIDIEKKLPNGNSVDFVFKSVEDKTPLYVDFISLHNIKPELLDSENEFVKFFENRFNQKIENKTKNLEFQENNLIIDDVKIPFIILPILWGDMECFIDKKKAIDELNSKYSNVSPLTSLMIQQSKENVLHYDFTTVTNILERIIDEKK